MRGLMAAVVGMGVLIVAGVAVLVVVMVQRVGGAAVPGAALLDEPAGTVIAEASGAADGVVLRLTGGGPDRVVVVDARNGRVLGRVGLAR